MKLPNFRRLIKTDYEKQFQGLIDQLSQSLNIGIETIYELGNKRISLRDNILCSIRDVEVVVDAFGKLTQTASMSLDTNGRVEGLSVIRAENITNATVYPTSSPFITFSQTDNGVLFSNIKGLPANNRFRLRVIAWQS